MRILITGGSSDIAKAIALNRQNFQDEIIITASHEESLKKTLIDYQIMNTPVTGFVYDFNHPERSIDAIKKLLEKPIDALILNAFTRVTRFRKWHELPHPMQLDYLIKNIQGQTWLIHQLIPAMLTHHFGRLVFVSSISAGTGTSRYGAYCAAKGAIESLFLNLAVDYSADNILSNIVRLGLIKTERTKAFWRRESYQDTVGKMIPTGKMGEPAQVAEAIDYLLSPTSYVTGVTLNVSGGLPLMSLQGMKSS